MTKYKPNKQLLKFHYIVKGFKSYETFSFIFHNISQKDIVDITLILDQQINILNLRLESNIWESTLICFNDLGINTDSLERPPEGWVRCESYIQAHQRVCSLKAVNDWAERGVKMASDFYDVSKSESMFQNALQGVEKSRKLVPNQRKWKAPEADAWAHFSSW